MFASLALAPADPRLCVQAPYVDQSYYRLHVKKYFHEVSQELKGYQLQCGAGERKGRMALKQTNWVCPSPAGGCKKTPFDLEKAACACSAEGVMTTSSPSALQTGRRPLLAAQTAPDM